MKEITYKNITVNVPESQEEVKFKIQKKIYKKTDKIDILAGLLDCQRHQLQDLPVAIYSKVFDTLKFIETDIPIKQEVPKVLNYEISFDDLSLGQQVDIEHLQKDLNANIGKIIAILCKPKNLKYSTEQDQKSKEQESAVDELSIVDIFTILEFFFLFKTLSKKALEKFTNHKKTKT